VHGVVVRIMGSRILASTVNSDHATVALVFASFAVLGSAMLVWRRRLERLYQFLARWGVPSAVWLPKSWRTIVTPAIMILIGVWGAIVALLSQ
jgi:hypothetical protein